MYFLMCIIRIDTRKMEKSVEKGLFEKMSKVLSLQRDGGGSALRTSQDPR